MNDKNEKNEKSNSFSNFGNFIRKRSETFSNKIINKISEVLDKGKIENDNEKQKEKILGEKINEGIKDLNKINHERKMTLTKLENADFQTKNILTIQEDEDHKIFKYCLDYEDDEEDLDDDNDDILDVDDNSKGNLCLNRNESSSKSPDLTKPSQGLIQDNNRGFAKEIFFPQDVLDQTNFSKISSIPGVKENVLSPNIRFNFDNISEFYKNQPTYKRNKMQGISNVFLY